MVRAREPRTTDGTKGSRPRASGSASGSTRTPAEAPPTGAILRLHDAPDLFEPPAELARTVLVPFGDPATSDDHLARCLVEPLLRIPALRAAGRLPWWEEAGRGHVQIDEPLFDDAWVTSRSPFTPEGTAAAAVSGTPRLVSHLRLGAVKVRSQRRLAVLDADRPFRSLRLWLVIDGDRLVLPDTGPFHRHAGALAAAGWTVQVVEAPVFDGWAASSLGSSAGEPVA